MKNRIQAFSSYEIKPGADGKLPDSIEWMPAGTNEIQCTRNGKPGARCMVTAKESDVATLNTQLVAARTKSDDGKASRPFLDFMHRGGESAAIPTEFFWQDGIRLRVEWSSAGAEAVSGRVFSYLSPVCDVDDAGRIIGIPDVGPIGGLVNTPAFQSIERIAASLTLPNMNNIAKALGLPETATEAEILAKIAELASAAEVAATEIEASKTALASETAKITALRTAAATAEVEAHATKAGIPTEARPMLIAGILANETDGRRILASFKPAAAVKPQAGAAPFVPARIEGGRSEVKEATGLARAIAAANAASGSRN